ncbi:protein TNT [Bubalus kerabau]|uniref:protein TNT n=1 Tax=Bubalus carabanensis TaxID=3119969 RepID=UPI00244E821D|nr:protein TNT [Bubalus carabanensis]
MVGFQGPLLLEKPSQLPPTFLQGRQGESPSGEAQETGAGLQSASLEPQSSAWPRHDAEATQEPLRDSSGHLGNTVSHESSVLSSLQHSSLEQCIDISRLSSGYAGDEENSKVSLPGSHQIVRLSRRLHTQAGGAQNSQVCAVYSPKQLKRRLAHQAKGTKQTGRE